MSVHAGTIVHVGGANVIDRIQSAGLGDVNLQIETIREVGNDLVVDKVPGDPDFTFSLESWDATTDLMAFLTGKVGAQAVGSPPGSGDAAGTAYHWEDVKCVNIISPWKDPDTSASTGEVVAGHIVPGYYPTRATYRFGVTDNASHSVDLAGGSFYYAAYAPTEDFAVGDGTVTVFVSDQVAVGHRKGGSGSTDYRYVFGVIVDGVLQIEGVDYTVTGGSITTPAVVTVTFATAPPTGAAVRFAYFTTAATTYPQTVLADATVKPGAVRGRSIRVYVGAGGARVRLASVQSFELDATVDSEVEREMGSDEIVGRTINGRDCTGTLVVRSKDAAAFIAMLAKVTGVAATEVFGYYNQNSIAVSIQILNPKTAAVIKTLVVDDGIFQPPGTPARVNTPTDFSLRFDSRNGTFREVKGAFVPA